MNHTGKHCHAYGAEGDPSVQINFLGDIKSAVDGWTGKDKKSHGETVTFNDTDLNLGISKNQKLQQWSKVVAHEGQHVFDDFNKPAISRMEAEVNAYTAQAYYEHAAKYSTDNVWTPGTGINYEAIKSHAALSNDYGQ